jgi:Raf kinase inhibitor-like YbhB/YbcL family protein
MRRHRLAWLLGATLALGLTGCDNGDRGQGSTSGTDDARSMKGDAMTIGLTSSAFDQGQPIPKRYSGEGQNISPPLNWDNIPDQARSLVLIVEDPDAPNRTFIHWVLYDIPVNTSGLAENVPHQPVLQSLEGAHQGPNSADKIGYMGPMPPQGHGPHRYFFRMYAVDANLNLPQGASVEQVRQAMEGHVVAQGELMGTYERE